LPSISAGTIYWTQKAPTTPEWGASCAPGIDVLEGRDGVYRSDAEVFFNVSRPIDLESNSEHRILDGTDRGDPPRGNTVNRAPSMRRPRRICRRSWVSD